MTMEAIERFIALPISTLSIVPAEPTRAPATIMMVLPSANPAIATAIPVQALSSEITTGMSAPPMGRTTSNPTDSADTTRTASGAMPSGVSTDQITARSATATAVASSIRCAGSRIGLPDTKPCSFPAAMSEPVTVTDPIRIPSAVGTAALIAAFALARSVSSTAIRAAAPPPTMLNALTSCGIAVIFTRLPVSAPMSAPVATAMISTTRAAVHSNPASAACTPAITTAAPMPNAEIALPRLAVRGEFIRCSPTTKATAQARYSSDRTPVSVVVISSSVHDEPRRRGGTWRASGRSRCIRPLR